MDLDNLPISPEEVVYNAVVARCTSNATLSGVFTTFQSCPFPFIPAPLQKLPLLRIEPGSGDIENATFQADKSTLYLQFTIWVPSRPTPGKAAEACGDARDIMRLWHQLKKVINFHSDDWLATALAAGYPGRCGYGGMKWLSTPINYVPNLETKALGGSATLAINLEVRD